MDHSAAQVHVELIRVASYFTGASLTWHVHTYIHKNCVCRYVICALLNKKS